MKFRSVLLLSTLSVLVIALVTAIAAASITLEANARRELADSLERSRQVFLDLHRYRETLYRSAADVVAEEPRLKAVTASFDVSPETVRGVAAELQRVAGSELFLLLDAEGRVVIDTADASAQGADLSGQPLVREAKSQQTASAVWTEGRNAYQVRARELRFGATPVGMLVLGHALGTDFAETVHRQTGTSVVIDLDGEPIVQSAFDEGAPPREVLRTQLQTIPAQTERPVELDVGGRRYLALSAPLPGYRGAHALRYVLLRSLDSALAPARRVSFTLFSILFGSLVCAGFVSLTVSRRVARPVQELQQFAERVGRGDLEHTVQEDGPREIRSLGAAMNRMTGELRELRRKTAEQERLRREMEIASQIQLSMLPPTLQVPHLEMGARMVTASEVGGDYYDVLPVPGGAWIGIGDVAGHGVPAGIVMLMVQSALSALARQLPDASPAELVCQLNAVLFDNIRARLRQDEHVTLTLFRFEDEGRLRYAGAHEEILVYRAATREIESFPTPGIWLGARKDISYATRESVIELRDGDVVLLHTDGITEARNRAREEFGAERLRAAFRRVASLPPSEAVVSIFDEVSAFSSEQADDATLLMFRYRSPQSLSSPTPEV